MLQDYYVERGRVVAVVDRATDRREVPLQITVLDDSGRVIARYEASWMPTAIPSNGLAELEESYRSFGELVFARWPQSGW
jgi:hypothetical protein